MAIALMSAWSVMADKGELVTVELADGTSKEYELHGGLYNKMTGLPLSKLTFTDYGGSNKQQIDLKNIQSITWGGENGERWVCAYYYGYNFVGTNAVDKLSKKKKLFKEIYAGKNIRLYWDKEVNSGTGIVRDIYYFQRNGEEVTYVTNTARGAVAGTELFTKTLLNYFTEKDFAERIEAGEFRPEKIKDVTIDYMIDIARAYDQR